MREILHSTPDTRNVVLATLDTPSVAATGCPDATFERDCCPAIEALAVAIIVLATAHGTVRYLLHLNQKIADAYTLYKIQLGRALLLGLEFLVAADIIRTVGLETTMQNVITVGNENFCPGNSHGFDLPIPGYSLVVALSRVVCRFHVGICSFIN
jgi:uncharacterized protein DUF1622